MWNTCCLHCYSFCKMFPINVVGQKQKSALKLFYDLLKAVYIEKILTITTIATKLVLSDGYKIVLNIL